jgi:hypothetical protein
MSWRSPAKGPGTPPQPRRNLTLFMNGVTTILLT